MDHIINISTGEVKKGSTSNILISNGIGSCIVVAALNFDNHHAGMAHIMLPGKAPLKETKYRTKYAKDAILKLLDLLEIKNNDTSKLKVCLIGAGNVLRKIDDRICTSNIHSILEILKEFKIEISAKALGGYLRKRVRFDVKNCKVYYTEGDSELRLLHSWYLK